MHMIVINHSFASVKRTILIWFCLRFLDDLGIGNNDVLFLYNVDNAVVVKVFSVAKLSSIDNLGNTAEENLFFWNWKIIYYTWWFIIYLILMITKNNSGIQFLRIHTWRIKRWSTYYFSSIFCSSIFIFY